jgi:hypothetical protein
LVLGLSFPGVDLILLLPRLQPLIRKVHLDGLSSAQLLLYQQLFTLRPESLLECWVKPLELIVVVWSSRRELEIFEYALSGLVDDGVKLLSLVLVAELCFCL